MNVLDCPALPIRPSDVTTPRPTADQCLRRPPTNAPACAAGALFLMFLAGTGGAMANPTSSSMNEIAAPTSASCQVRGAVLRRQDDSESLDTGEKIAFVQEQFSLNLSMAAAVLRVSRPTLYAWLRGEAEPHAGNLARIDHLYSLAQSWRRLSTVPLGRFGRRTLSAGTSVFGLLANAKLDDAKLSAAFVGVAQMLAREQAAAWGGESITARARKQYGFPEPTAEERARTLSDNTGI